MDCLVNKAFHIVNIKNSIMSKRALPFYGLSAESESNQESIGADQRGRNQDDKMIRNH